MSKNQNGNNGRNNNSRRGGERGQRVNARGEQMEVLFAEQQFGRQTKIICYLGDGTVIYPGSRRFQPRPGKKYLCDVRYKNQDKKVGLARPVLPYTLSPEEWVPDSALRTVMVRELVFQRQNRDGKERLIAFDNGQAVFPDHGTEVSVGKPRAYMLRERGTVSFAIALPEEARSGGTGLVKLAEKLQEWSPMDLRYIVLKRASNKAGVAVARTEKDVEIVTEYRDIYDLLGVPLDASPEEVKKAFREKSKAVHPDKVAQSWSRDGKEPPLLVKMSAQFFFDALKEAQDRAVEAFERAADESKKSSGAPKGAKDDGAKKRSKRGGRGSKPRAPKTEAKEAPKADNAPVAETVVAEAPKADVTEEPVVEATKEEVVNPAEAEAAKTSTEVSAETQTTEDGDPIGDDGKVYGEYTVEEWSELSVNVKKFKRRYGKVRASSPAATAPKTTDAKSGSTTQAKQPESKGDWQQQLAKLAKKS